MAATAPSATTPPASAPLSSSVDLVRYCRERLEQAKTARKPQERIWLSNLAFAAGQQWLVWDRVAGSMRHIQDVDPRKRDRVLYTADRIREYREAQLGELNSDDDRPELLTAVDGDTAEEIAKELNAASEHEWRHESHAPDVIARARGFCLDMGVSAIRRRFDPTKGPVTDHQPFDTGGQPVTEQAALQALAANGQLPDGSLPRYQQVNEGRSLLEAFTALQILPPPGVVHEDDFPWEGLVRPVHVDDIYDLYGVRVTEDGDIASASGLTHAMAGATRDQKLRDHAWLYSFYRRPCRDYPDGLEVALASNSFTLCDVQQQLPYLTPDGTRSAGITYLHWWRLSDRFWSRSFIEPLKDPQRALNETKTIKREILARGLPKAFVTKGSMVEKPTGVPMEIIEIDQGAAPPIFHQGVGPGPWWDTDIAEAEADLSHASTLSALRLGENQDNVQTYSQLALLNENEGLKRDAIRSDHRRQIARQVEYGVHDIRQWWPEEKLILVSGPEGGIARQSFAKSKVPDFYMASVASGAPLPQSQAAQLKLVDAIWAAAAQSGLVVQDPDGWTRWYAESLKAGEPLELPEVQKDSQQQYAAFENFLMQNGEDVEPADYDLLPVHIPVHREAQDQARAVGDMETFQRIALHVQKSVALTQANAAQVAGAQQAPTPLPPPPGGANPIFARPDFQQLATGN